MKFFILATSIILTCTLKCVGQEAAFKNYNEQNGLPSSEVYHVFQDSKGFIWFATDNGVVRFDGGEFKLFNKSNGLADAVVFSVMEDSNNDLWFRTFAGVTSTYKDGKMIPYKFNDRLKSLPSDRLASMVVDSLGQPYFYDNVGGIFRVNSKGEFKVLPTENSSLNIYEVAKNQFICGYLPKAWIYIQSASFKGKTYKIEHPQGETLMMSCKRWNDQIYIPGGPGGQLLYRLEGSMARPVFDAHEAIISLSVDTENNFWIGLSGKGVLKFSDNSFLHPQRITPLKDRSVTSVLQDREGGLWISTLEKGVYYFPNVEIKQYAMPEDSKMNFGMANDKYVLIGFYSGMVLCIDKRTRKTKWSIDLAKPIVAGVFLEKDNLCWISTSHGSFLLNELGNVVKRFPRFDDKGTPLISKKFFSSGNEIWGVNMFGALEFDLKSNLLRIYPLGFWCRNILINNEDVYLAGITGLRKTDKSFKRIVEIEAFKNDKITGLSLLPGNKILVATGGSGLKIINGDKIESFSKADGLIFESVYSSTVDRFLWLGTEKGLLKVDLELLLKKGAFNYDLLDKGSGLMSNKVSFILRNENETWCFFNDGFSVFADQQIHFANTNPIPRVNRLTVNSKSVESPRLLDLSYNENNIGIELGFQSYDNRNIFLRHKALPTDQWNYTEDFSINYNALAPDRYEIQIEYSTDYINWRKLDFQNVVVIRPVWWETVYFRLAILAVTALIFFIYFRSKYKSRLLKLEMAEKLKAEKERIAQDLHDNIGSKLVSLSLGLNQVVKQYDIANETAEMIYSNVNTTVTELRDTIWAIQKEGVTIAEFCDKIKNLVWRLRQNNGSVQYDLQIKTEQGDNILKPSQAINLHRIVQEAIANSQKHSNASLVSIYVFYDESIDRLYIKIEDNGRGFEMNASGDEHYGLKNMRSRAEEIAALIEITSKIGDGTRIAISLPLQEKQMKG